MFDSDSKITKDKDMFVSWEQSLRDMLEERCSPEEQQAFWDLADTEFGREQVKTAIGICRTNALSFDQDRAGLFPQIGRFNHCCTPNVASSWDLDSEMQV